MRIGTVISNFAVGVHWALCGSAASSAESLRLSVRPATFLAATPPEAKPLVFYEADGKPEAFRTGGGRAANRFPHGSRKVKSISNQLR